MKNPDDGSPDDGAAPPIGVTRYEQGLRVGTRTEDVGSLRVRKTVEAQGVSDVFQREVEHGEPARTPPLEEDSGEIITLADGSVSVPVFEEELVVTKRLVVRERILVQKHRVAEAARVQAELLRERVEVEADPDVERQGDPG